MGSESPEGNSSGYVLYTDSVFRLSAFPFFMIVMLSFVGLAGLLDEVSDLAQLQMSVGRGVYSSDSGADIRVVETVEETVWCSDASVCLSLLPDNAAKHSITARYVISRFMKSCKYTKKCHAERSFIRPVSGILSTCRRAIYGRDA